jgi:hypothetical protein
MIRGVSFRYTLAPAGRVHLPGDVAGKGEWRAMMAHELLRQAAQILGAGWSKGADARPFRECR